MTWGPRSVRPADNPFASHRVEDLAFRSPGSQLPELARRVGQLGGRAAIVGGEGTGKTTLLHELAGELPGEPILVSLGGGCRRPGRAALDQLPRPVREHHAVLIDGGERLDAVRWRLFMLAARRAGSLVATLHRPGRLPTLIECRTDSRLLAELVAELAPSDPPALDLDELFDRHRGDIRQCLRELYDLHAGREEAYSFTHTSSWT
jgi:hypothetical protein